MYAADKAWIVLGAGVLAWDLLAPVGQTLSEGADIYMERHPWLTRAVAASLALHVCNAVPDRCDPVHGLFLVSRRWRRP